MKIMFLWRILLLPMANWYKQIAVEKIIQYTHGYDDQRQGPIWNILKVYEKYSLMKLLVDSVQQGEYIGKMTFKKMVKATITDHDRKMLTANSLMYRSLEHLDLNNWRMVGWWSYGKECPWYIKRCRLVVRLLLNSYRLGNQICALCINGQQNNILHILFQCEALADDRIDLWQAVCDSAPKQLAHELRNMTVTKQCEYLLNALKCDYVKEWSKLYKAMMFYVCTLYMEYDSMNNIR